MTLEDILLTIVGGVAGYCIRKAPITIQRPSLYLQGKPKPVCVVDTYHYPDGEVVEHHSVCKEFPDPQAVPEGWTVKKSGGHEV